MNMEEEKRNAIINAAMKEFALRGYKDAKTDNIVKNAGISKGLLFHYFGTKKNLFLFIFDYAMDICKNKYLALIDMNETDVFNRLKQNAMLKIKLIPQNPDLFNFIMSINSKGIEEMKDEIEEKKKEFFNEVYPRFFSGLDFSKFKDDVDPKQAINIIIWTMEGFVNKAMAKYMDSQVRELDFSSYISELDDYFKLLKRALYK